MAYFEALLNELGTDLETTLTPDEKGFCLVVLKNKVNIQIQPSTLNRILICSTLGTLPPGAFRETLLRGALMNNGSPPPLYGILSYSTAKDSLILFEFLDQKNLNNDDFIKYFRTFSKKAEQWMDAINSGELPTIIKDASGVKNRSKV